MTTPEQLFSVSGRRVLVTGGTRGIGRMLAAGYVAAGAEVWITGRDPARCRAAAGSLGCRAIPADLSTEAGCDVVTEAVRAELDHLDILVNNAGATWGAPLEEHPASAFDRVWDLNVKALFRLTVSLLPLLRAAASPEHPSRVLNIGSVDGIRVASRDVFAYAASKSGVHLLTRMLAARLAVEHVTVNALAPGPFETRMTAFAQRDPEVHRAMVEEVPLRRFGTEDDIVGAALFLTSRAGSYVTGAVLPVDGGLSGCV